MIHFNCMMEHHVRDKGGTNWEICFICQEETGENLRSTTNGLATLNEMLIKFSEIDALDFDIEKLIHGSPDLLSSLLENNAKYHHSCNSKFYNRMLERAKSRKKKESGKEREQPSCSRRSISEESHYMGELLCFVCLKKDELQHLVAAGTLHATEN